MSCPAVHRSLRRLVREPQTASLVPVFLLPCLAKPYQARSFSCSAASYSRVGGAAISIPPEVSLRFFDLPKSNVRSRAKDVPVSAVEVAGPLGQMTLPLPPYLAAKHNTKNQKVTLSVGDPTITHQRAMWGTIRAHLQNYILGVSEGHSCVLRLVGVGYRATIENTAITKTPEYPGQQFVSLKLGYAHPIEMPIPLGVKASVPQPTRILLEGCEKQVVAQFAAEIREWRKPEPYKGKGIFVNNETIKLKAKKIK
ncbi:hypothetical protein GJ744_005288 [Endocarpon pusillum]|uniref:Large ribosomal subunit protein uL6 alpha-beta domain-containing protein n=1 Tax=Endocarpon pusillum TaxID=364733 RepID=A0A8H7AQD2_9EURO|nr:hypothetical protein GJ744_005288 [Endocarpon pusillum]